MEIKSITGIGRRSINQDVICIEELSLNNLLLLVVDGMGGYEKGEEAAEIVVDRMLTFLRDVEIFDQKIIQQAIQKANLGVKRFNKEHNLQSGAAVGGIIISNNLAHIFWVGDVKIFQFRNESIHFESKSHTLLESLKENNSFENPESLTKYKHILMRSISGKAKEAEIGYYNTEVNNSEFLICSDGAYDVLDIRRIYEMLNEDSLEEYLKNNTEDNYSVIFMKKQ